MRQHRGLITWPQTSVTKGPQSTSPTSSHTVLFGYKTLQVHSSISHTSDTTNLITPWRAKLEFTEFFVVFKSQLIFFSSDRPSQSTQSKSLTTPALPWSSPYYQFCFFSVVNIVDNHMFHIFPFKVYVLSPSFSQIKQSTTFFTTAQNFWDKRDLLFLHLQHLFQCLGH